MIEIPIEEVCPSEKLGYSTVEFYFLFNSTLGMMDLLSFIIVKAEVLERVTTFYLFFIHKRI